MFIKRLNLFFLFVTILGSIFLVFSWYKNYQFKNNPLEKSITWEINKKHKTLQNITYKKFNINKKFPVIISDKMPSKLFGAATYSKTGKIEIYLNKKHFQESLDYMIEDVLPHEYAHALMFLNKSFTDKKGGHTKQWQNICKSLNGLRCDRFVNNHDIIIGKTNFF